MANNKHHTIHKHEPIRNLTAFLKSYVTSESFKRAVSRQASYDEHTIRDKKGEYTYRDNFKGNQIALALQAAIAV